MPPEMEPEPTPTWMVVTGWIISALPALALLALGTMKLMSIKPPEGGPNTGWAESAFFGLGIIEVGCTVLYLLPRTAMLGAILLTGYLGGAVATHLRIGDQFFPPIILGVLVWFGLLLRDERVRALLPWRRPELVPATGGFLAGLGKVLLTIVALIGVFAALVAALPSEYHVERSATMDAPRSDVFAQVNDFRKWDDWSPWVKLDPNAKVTFEGEAGKDAVMRWVGNSAVGKGSMTILESVPNERIKIRLHFVEPMEGEAITDFTFKAKGEQTVVTWSMDGKSDYLGKTMCAIMSMEKMIGGKYEEGLKNIKAIVEKKK